MAKIRRWEQGQKPSAAHLNEMVDAENANMSILGAPGSGIVVTKTPTGVTIDNQAQAVKPPGIIGTILDPSAISNPQTGLPFDLSGGRYLVALQYIQPSPSISPFTTGNDYPDPDSWLNGAVVVATNLAEQNSSSTGGIDIGTRVTMSWKYDVGSNSAAGAVLGPPNIHWWFDVSPPMKVGSVDCSGTATVYSDGVVDNLYFDDAYLLQWTPIDSAAGPVPYAVAWKGLDLYQLCQIDSATIGTATLTANHALQFGNGAANYCAAPTTTSPITGSVIATISSSNVALIESEFYVSNGSWDQDKSCNGGNLGIVRCFSAVPLLTVWDCTGGVPGGSSGAVTNLQFTNGVTATTGGNANSIVVQGDYAAGTGITITPSAGSCNQPYINVKTTTLSVVTAVSVASAACNEDGSITINLSVTTENITVVSP